MSRFQSDRPWRRHFKLRMDRIKLRVGVTAHFPHICERISANFPAGRPEREGYSGVLSSMSF
jgi:hypothetical protein